MKNSVWAGCICIGLGALSLNCGSAPGVTESKSDKFTIDVITAELDANGNRTFKNVPVARTEVKRWYDAKLQRTQALKDGLPVEGLKQAPSPDWISNVGCSWETWNGLWMADEEDVPMEAEHLCCVNGAGDANLSSLCGSGFHVLSFYSGDLPGSLARTGVYDPCAQEFGSNEYNGSMSTCFDPNRVALWNP